MAKFKRQVIGSVLKGKKDESTGVTAPDYIQINDDVVLKKGQFLNLESKAQQQKSLDAAAAAGKISGEALEAVQARINKIPDFVRFHIIRLERQD